MNNGRACDLLGKPREPLINLVISLRDLRRLVVRRLSQLMALVLNKKGNAANDRRRPRPMGLTGI